MKRRKLALVMAAAMVLTSVPANGFIGYAEELPAEVLELEASGGEEILLEEGLPEGVGTNVSGVSDEGIQGSGGAAAVPDGIAENSVPEIAPAGDGGLVIESISELETAEELSGLGELTEEDLLELQIADALAAESTNGSVTEVDGKKVATAAPGEYVTAEVKPGETLTLSIAAENTEGWSFKWVNRNSNETISDATGSSYDVSNLAQNTEFWCSMTDAEGQSKLMARFYVKVDSGLEIIGGNIDAQAEIGGSASVYVNASVDVDSEISYEWHFWNFDTDNYEAVEGLGGDAAVEPNENGSRLTLSNLQHEMRGDCVISDSYGNTRNYYWTVRVKTFTVEHVSETIPVLVQSGESTTLSVSATPVAAGVNLTYQWYTVKEMEPLTPIENETGSSFEVANITGYTGYCCGVSDGYTYEYVYFDVSVDSGLQASAENTSFYVNAGETVKMQVQASVTSGSLHYEWYKGLYGERELISDATADIYTITAKKSGDWICRVSDDYGRYEDISFRVQVQTLTVQGEGMQQQVPASRGETKTLSVTASTTSGEEITYQWYIEKNMRAEEIPGATKSSYTTDAITGTVTYGCYVRDGNQTKTISFRVMVDTGLALDSSKTKTWYDVTYGEPVTLLVAASVNEGYDVSYQWFRYTGMGYEKISGANEGSYTVAAASGQEQYQCQVSDTGGNTLYVYVTVHADTLVFEEDTEQEITAEIGKPITLEAKVRTSIPNATINYQWYKGEYLEITETIPNANDRTYMIDSMKETGWYCCVVGDGTNSEEIWFHVIADSGLTVSENSDLIVFPGESRTLRVEASTKVGTPSYQWYQYEPESDGILIEGATSSEYELKNIQGNNAYFCRVTDGYNTEDVWFRIDVESDLVCNAATNTDFLVSKGETVTMGVSVTSSLSGITYEWMRRPCYGEDPQWETVENATGSTLTVTADQSMYYQCWATDGYGEDYMSFSVLVNSGLEIREVSAEWVEYPGSDGNYEIHAKPGDNISVSIDATSELGKLTYKWAGYDGISNVTGSSVTLENVAKSGWCYCIVRDGYQEERIEIEIILDTGLTASAEAAEVEAESGADATLRVNASVDAAYGPVTYTWYRGQLEETDTNSYYEYVEIENETGSSLVVKNVTGIQQYYCTVSDSGQWNTKDVYFTVAPKGVLDSLANSFERAKTLTEGTAQSAVIGILYDKAYFKFVPERSGVYTIVSLGDSDTVGSLYDGQRNELAYNDDGSENLNFELEYELNAGRTYYIAAGFYSEDDDGRLGEFQVLATYQGAGEMEEHQWDDGTVTQAATCTEDGVRTFTCLMHGETYAETIDALGHDYPQEWTTQKEATCTEAGSKYRACARCGEVENETIAPKGHTFGEELRQDPTATENGMVYKKCSVCDQEEILEILPATGVSDSLSEVQGIVDKLGQEGSDANITDAVDKITAIDNDALAEIMDQPIGDTNPKSPMETIKELEEKLIAEDAQTGLTGKITASSVAANLADPTVAPEKVQVEGAAVTVAAALKNEITPDANTVYQAQLSITEDKEGTGTTEDGKKVYALDISMDIVAVKADGTGSADPVKENVQPAAPIRITMPVPQAFQGAEFTLYHTVNGTDVPVSYTKNADGTISFYAASLSPWQLVLEKCAENAHKYVEETTKAPTCTETGVKVSRCSICGDEKTEIVGKAPHTWSEWITDKAADCTEKGSQTHSCSVCNATETQELPPLGHDLKTVVDKAATCSAAGSQHRECAVCGYKEAATEIPATGAHTMKTVVDKAATCGVAGSQHAECTVCGHKEAATEIPATGAHTMKTVVDKAATCGVAGSQHRECTTCGYKEGATAISATGAHTMKTVTDKAATCGAAGSQHAECTACGYKEAATAIPATGRHTFGNWATTQDATVFADGISARSCTVCGAQETTRIAKLTPTITLNATSLPLKVKQSTTKLKVSGLAAGDSVVSWQSSNQKIVKVNASGKITAQKKTGKAVITITLASGLQANVQVKVQKGTVKTSKITNIVKKLTLKKGETAKLEPIITPITTTDKLSYTSSNKKVATVSKKGVITAKGSGKAKITVKSGSKKVVITVTVAKTAPTGITGVKDAITMKKGKSTTLKPKLAPKGAEAKIKYSSSNKKIATVNAKGKVTAKKKGTAVITITAGGIKKTCTITVK